MQKFPGLINSWEYSRKVSKIPGKFPHLKIPRNFGTLAVCTDNYLLNVCIYKCFSANSKLRPKVQHPCMQSTEKFNYFFKFVHIIKSIRNNWLNLKKFDNTVEFAY